MSSDELPSGKKVRAKIVDPEINDSLHDELFVWLIKNLERVVAKPYSRTMEQLTEYLNEAHRRWRYDDSVGFSVSALSRVVSEYRDSNPLLASEAAKTLAMARTLIEQAPPRPALSSGLAKLVRYTTQEPIVDEDARPPRVAGFIDVIATIAVPMAFHASWSFPPCGPYDLNSRSQKDEGAAQARILKDLKSWKGERPSWSTSTVELKVYIDVRARPGAIGALARDMKTLRRHIGPESHLALLVERMQPAHREILRNDRVLVIERDEN